MFERMTVYFSQSKVLLKMLRSPINQGIRKFGSNPVKCHRLEGKVAIVTASTDGIGYSIARRLAQEGAKVMISSRKEANVKKAVDQLKSEGLDISGVVCHVGKAEDRKNLFEQTKAQFGGLDVLVSNAAVNPTAEPLLDCTEEAWDKIFDINVKSSFLLIKESLPLLSQSKSGSIILISSIVAYKPMGMLGVYAISKTALQALGRAVANDLISYGIRVNSIAPGIIKTKFSKTISEGEIGEMALKVIPMRKFGVPEDIAGIASFLASDDASYITGETIVAAGGMRSRL